MLSCGSACIQRATTSWPACAGTMGALATQLPSWLHRSGSGPNDAAVIGWVSERANENSPTMPRYRNQPEGVCHPPSPVMLMKITIVVAATLATVASAAGGPSDTIPLALSLKRYLVDIDKERANRPVLTREDISGIALTCRRRGNFGSIEKQFRLSQDCANFFEMLRPLSAGKTWEMQQLCCDYYDLFQQVFMACISAAGTKIADCQRCNLDMRTLFQQTSALQWTCSTGQDLEGLVDRHSKVIDPDKVPLLWSVHDRLCTQPGRVMEHLVDALSNVPTDCGSLTALAVKVLRRKELTEQDALEVAYACYREASPTYDCVPLMQAMQAVLPESHSLQQEARWASFRDEAMKSATDHSAWKDVIYRLTRLHADVVSHRARRNLYFLADSFANWSEAIALLNERMPSGDRPLDVGVNREDLRRRYLSLARRWELREAVEALGEKSTLLKTKVINRGLLYLTPHKLAHIKALCRRSALKTLCQRFYAFAQSDPSARPTRDSSPKKLHDKP